MLVLDRKVQEGFWIDKRIFVKVLAIGRQRVKLGIEAPSDMAIVREELIARAGEDAEARRMRIVSEESQGSFRSVRQRD